MSRRRLPSKRDVFVLRGIDARTGVFFGPFSTVPRFDEVTGDPLPIAQMGIQRGLVKNTDPRRGSWDTKNPVPAIWITYDPALGVATRAAGQTDSLSA